MEIQVNNNSLRLLAKSFMLVLPVKHIKLEANGKYTIIHERYGKLGIAECQQINTIHLCEVKPLVGLMSSGSTFLQSELRDQYRLLNTDLVQCAAFRFIRRYDEPFKNLIQMETKNAGIEFSFQTQLFNQ